MWRMGTARWNTIPSVEEPSKEDRRHLEQFEHLTELLKEEPFRVEFFQAVRMLERIEKDANAVGYFVPPNSEAIRFSAHTSLSAFHPARSTTSNAGRMAS